VPALLLIGCARRPREFGEFHQALDVGAGAPITVAFNRVDAAIASEVFRAVEAASAPATRWGELLFPVEVQVHATHAELEAAAGYNDLPWLRAWATDRVIHVQSPRTWGGGETEERLEELLTHEMTHVVMYQHSLGGGPIRQLKIPVWFLEGMASVTASQGYRRRDAESLGLYLGQNPEADLFRPSLSLYRHERDLVYSAAHLAFRYLVESAGEDAVRAILGGMRRGAAFDQAFRDAVGESAAVFEDRLAAIIKAAAK
jgi:hypothetical protein